jgi:pimeloyl-ACP methyl ester carboxylesterase
MDQLADQVARAGIDTHVYRENQWTALERAIDRKQRSDSPARPLVLIGFSYGADDVLRIAQDLGRDGIDVDLLITIDPVTPPPVPGNVRRCYNYFQSNGIWDLFPWLRGIPLRTSRPGQLINVDLRRDRRDLLEPNTSHATIAANPKLQREIVARVIEASPGPNASRTR